MQHHPNPSAELDSKEPEPVGVPRPSWQTEVDRFLSQAAALCVQHGVDVESFMKGAWSSYVEARPGMRDYLEEMQLRDQLEEIRKTGRMAEA